MLALAGVVALMAAWSAPGHRTITRVAVSLLPADLPSWYRDAAAGERAAYQANEPDRWRGTHVADLAHINNGDHYIDVEYLADYGLSLRTLPRLRYALVEAVVRAEAREGGERARFDPDRVGFLPWAITERYAKLVSSLNSARILERLGGQARVMQLEQARANVAYHMGQLSHFVGDAGQPLHTTIHHHGWVGENPRGFTTDRGFHRRIDGAIVAHHALDADALRSMGASMEPIEPGGAWDAAIGLIERSFDAVERLYVLEQTGALEGDGGRRFIAQRMMDSAGVLAGLYHRAWIESEPTDRQVEGFVRYNSLGAEDRPAHE